MELESSGWRRREIGSGPAADSRTTFFTRGCEPEGKLAVAHSIEIEGEFRGAISCEETVTVAASAAVEARISARTVVIRGAVVGDVEASREVVIHASGRLHGAVRTPSLVVERGAFFTGQTQMYRPEIVARTRAAAEVVPAPS